MERRNAAATAVILLAISGCTPKVDLEAERNAIRNADAEWSKLTASKGAEGYLELAADNISTMPPNEPLVSGKEAARQWATKLIGSPGFSVSWQPTGAEVSTSGDLGYTMGTYELKMQAEGTPINDHGKYVTVWRKQADGSWKVVADIFNSDLPLPAAPPAPPALPEVPAATEAPTEAPAAPPAESPAAPQ